MGDTEVIVELDKISDDIIDRFKGYGMKVGYVLDNFKSVTGSVNRNAYEKLLEDKDAKRIRFAQKAPTW